MLGIIGGSGLDRMDGLEIVQQSSVDTPYGQPSSALSLGRLNGQDLLFLPRHGSDHSIAPHRINYRANLWALHAQGVTAVIAVAAVGGIAAELESGTLVVPEQLIDYTHGRETTYFDGVANPLKHVDFTRPFSAAIRLKLLRAGIAAGVPLRDGGTYAATQGPRLETAAEIDRLARDGADIVGMTGMPEAVLARELDMAYAMLAVVVNAAAGRGTNVHGVAIAEIDAVAATAMKKVLRILAKLEAVDGD
jgi:5'-methylthioinosine phosphorylase